MRRADRLFQIVQHLRAQRLTTAAHLGDLLQVSERTIYRDIRDLSLSGIPVQGEAGVGYRIDKSFELTALMFTPDEVEAVVVALRMARRFGGAALRAASVTALDKIILALPQQRRKEVDQPRMFVPILKVDEVLELYLDVMRQAIAEHRVVTVTYADGQDKNSQRQLRPLALHFWGASWTLAAWCELRLDFRTFRLDRCRACELTDRVFVEEKGRTLQDYLRAQGAE